MKIGKLVHDNSIIELVMRHIFVPLLVGSVITLGRAPVYMLFP